MSTDPAGAADTELRSALLDAFREPAFYPHRPADVELVETHISWVFLAGDLAYKLRKPVVLPFLDYGTEERRRRMCEEEVRLGRRLAPGIYIGVRAVVRGADGGFELAEPGAAGAVEHAVEMRRVDQSRTLAALLAGGTVTEDDVRRVARRIADFHAGAERFAGSSPAAAVAAQVAENFSTLIGFAGELGDARLAPSHRFAVAFLHARRALLDGRDAAGFVRDCHGDLRAQHVIVGDEVEVYDPVEFDPRLRRIDVAADLAFLVMDLHGAGRADLAAVLVEEYRRVGGDCGPDALLSFYAAYRAWVRAKVACVRAAELADGGERDRLSAAAGELAAVARRLEWRARCPLAVIVCGRSASGKSVLAAELARRSGWAVVGSDRVRKELLGVAPAERAPEQAYTEEQSLRVYRELGGRASRAATDGVIVDATFRRRSHRDAFSAAARQVAPLYVQCVAPEPVLAERALLREREPGQASDADASVVARQAAELEPLDEVAPADLLILRTDRSRAAAADAVEAWLDERLAGGGA